MKRIIIKWLSKSFFQIKNTVLKFSRGKHFKAPTPNDLFWPYEDWGWGMGAEGNPNLKPETGWNTDATAEQTFFDSTGTATLCPYPGAGRYVFLVWVMNFDCARYFSRIEEGTYRCGL